MQNTKYKIKLRGIALAAALAAAAVSLPGCVGQQLDECDVVDVSLSYRFGLNNSQVPLSGYVKSLRLYIFDLSTGLLVRTVPVGGGEIDRGSVQIRGLGWGRFTFIAWAVDGDDVLANFSELHMLDHQTSQSTEMQVGQTTLEEFCLMIDHVLLPEHIPGDVTPDHNVEELFHASAPDVEILPGVNTTVELVAIRNTNRLEVSVSGIDNLRTWWIITETRSETETETETETDTETDTDTDTDTETETETNKGTGLGVDTGSLDIYVLGANGRYGFDNSIAPHARQVHYPTSAAEIHSSDHLTAQVDLLRIDVDRHASQADPVTLVVADIITGRTVVEIDVVEAIGQVRDSKTGELLYDTQSEVDEQHTFEFKIVIGPKYEKRIFIKEWEVYPLTPIPIE